MPETGYDDAGDKVKIKKRGMLAECEGLSLARVNNMSFILMPRKPTEF